MQEPAMEKLGIYGGTFAPPHMGHVRAAQAFLRSASLDRLLIVPAAIPPHKEAQKDDDPELRLALAHAAFDGLDPRIEVSDYEVRKAGVSYTYETLQHFRYVTGGASLLYFLCGTDMFLTLDRWRSPEVIFSLACVACVMRTADPAPLAAVREKQKEYEDRFCAHTMLIDSEPLPLSSTQIREYVREGKSIGTLVPEAVETIIRERGLYRDGNAERG